MNETPHLLDDAACGLARTASDGVFLHANRTFCDWTGYAGSELCGKRKLQELLTMGGRIFHQTHWHPLLQLQGSVSEVKLEIVHQQGHTLPMVMNAVRRQRDGATVHDIAVYIARDRDMYERELLASRRKLEALVAEARRLQLALEDRALFAEQMVGIVSHDLRNPLSTILMGTALLTRGDATPNQLRVLGRLARAAERANRLITDLLDFTQARMGKGIAIRRQPMDLQATVSEVVEELALAYPGRKLLHAHAGRRECVADADRLSQLVGNLVSNAMSYGHADAPVTVTSAIDESGACTVSVHNRGAPIPAEIQSVLFQPMVRGPDQVQPGSSVGLGLFIVAEIAKAHGGTVSVESSAEMGTRFSAQFPGV